MHPSAADKRYCDYTVTKTRLITNKPKARVTLARAIYSPAQILLLDDVLAALDVHTARWVVEKCLQGDLVRDRTVILVVSYNLYNKCTVLTSLSYCYLLDPQYCAYCTISSIYRNNGSRR